MPLHEYIPFRSIYTIYVLEDGTEETYNIRATNKKCIVKQLLYNKRL